VTLRIEFTSAASRDWRDLSKDVQRRLAPAIDSLADNPHPPGSLALRGNLRGVIRLRVGDWRIVYQVDAAQSIVTIVEIAHRSHVYKRAGR